MDYSMSLTGLLVGFLVGLTGMGGGALLAPIMILFFKLPPVFAVGIDFVYGAITKAFGAAIHIKQHHVNFSIARTLSYGTIPAVIISSLLVNQLKTHYGNSINSIISNTIGIVLIVAALLLFAKPYLLKKAKKIVTNSEEKNFLHKHKKVITILVGACIGLIVGLTSIGSGSMLIVTLAFLYPELPAKMLVGTDIFQAFLLLIVGSIIYLSVGSVDLKIVGSLVVGSIPGVIIGSRLSRHVPDHIFRPILAIVLILTGIKLLY